MKKKKNKVKKWTEGKEVKRSKRIVQVKWKEDKNKKKNRRKTGKKKRRKICGTRMQNKENKSGMEWQILMMVKWMKEQKNAKFFKEIVL